MHALGNATGVSSAAAGATGTEAPECGAAASLNELDARTASLPRAAGFAPTAPRAHRSSTRAVDMQGGVVRPAGGIPAGVVDCVGPPHLVNAWRQGAADAAASGSSSQGLTSGSAMAGEFLGKLQAALVPSQYETVRKAIGSYTKVCQTTAITTSKTPWASCLLASMLITVVCIFHLVTSLTQGGVTTQALTDTVIGLLRGGPAEHLLPAFGGFLPKRDRAAYAARIAYVGAYTRALQSHAC